MGEAVAIGLVAVLILVYLLLMGFLILNYVFQSLSLHTLARRRGIANPWLAWIPFGDSWIIGALARDYDKQNGISRRWDKILLILSIVGIATFSVIYIAFFVYLIINIATLDSAGVTYGEDIAFEMLGGILVFYVLLIASAVIMSAVTALTYICLYKIFESTVPEKAIKYFLIYLLVPFAAPFCLFACRNKGYEHPDPMAYIYNPVDKDYTYYRPAVTESTPADEVITSSQPDIQSEEAATEEQPDIEK